MKTVVPFAGNALPSTKSLKQGLSNVQNELAANAGPGGTLLRMTKQGDWVYGADSIDMEEGAKIAINPYTMAHGCIKWGDGQVEGESMVSIMDAKPDTPSGWDDQFGMQLRIMDGDDEGLELIYKGTSLGLKKAFRKLVDEIGARVNNDEEALVPVVVLSTDNYKHKQYGKIYNPILTIVDWIALDAAEATEADSDAEAEAEVETKEPTRRRRRS